MSILITGTAGFIGFHLSRRLIQEGKRVVGIDIINNYYDINLKYGRLKEKGIDHSKIEYGLAQESSVYPNYTFIKCDLNDHETLQNIFMEYKFTRVINLAAQAGVRYSLENPRAYIDSNISGFANILECCRNNKIRHLIYASSSSVYGLNKLMPFSTSHNVDHPISLYAASKKSNELMAHTYSHLFGLSTTGLRFFTVYGPWGRPDMALFIFTKAILEGKPIQINNNGNMSRDFTYVDDIVESIISLLDKEPQPDPGWNGLDPDPATSPAPYRIYNIGNNSPVKLMDFVRAIEKEMGKEAKKEYLPMQAGDVEATWANVDDLINITGFRPATPIEKGIRNFIAWYKSFYSVNK